jgi:hypothetical protein
VTHDTARDVPRQIFAARDLLGCGDDFHIGRSGGFRKRDEEIRERETCEADERDDQNECGTKEFPNHTSQSRRRTSTASLEVTLDSLRKF